MKLFVLILPVFLLSCVSPDVSKRTPDAEIEAVEKLESRNDIWALETGNPSYIKFVIDISDADWKLYYFNSKKFKLHTGFLKEHLGLKQEVEELYKLAHYNESRKYFFGALVKSRHRRAITSFGSHDGLDYQISASDIIKLEDLIKIDLLLKGSIGFDAGLAYLPAGSQADFIYRKENRRAAESAGVKIAHESILQNDVYAQGFTVGNLKVVGAKEIESGAYLPQPDDILVLDYVPLSLSPVRGVITSQPTSANSHVSLLTDMLSIPFMFVSGAAGLKSFTDLDGQKVFFKPFESRRGIRPYSLMKIDDEIYERFDKVLRERFPKIEVEVDASNVSQYRDFPVLASSDPGLKTGLCGAKATNSDFLRKSLESKFGKELGREKSLDGFCIPFYYFDTFMRMNKVGSQTLREHILTKLAALGENPKVESIYAVSAEIQQAIQDAKVSESHLESIRKKVMAHFGKNSLVKKVRFRSSSNAEDDVRFNGAGLYESDGVKMKHFKNNNLAKVEEALKTVWSSLYGVRAYTARRQFKMSEKDVYMGILVNQAFDEDARGVALCRLDRQYDGDFDFVCEVEGFPGGDNKVTHPPKGKQAEVSTLSLTKDSQNEEYARYNVKTVSTETPRGVKLFTDEEVLELLKIFEPLFKDWKESRNSDLGLEMDFEWKRMLRADGSKYMITKQMREVPKLDVVGFNEPVLMIDKNELLVSSGGLNEFGPIGHAAWASYTLDIPLMLPLKKLKEDFVNVKIKMSDFAIDEKVLNIKKVNYARESEWQDYQYSPGEEYKEHSVLFETDHPYFNDLNMMFFYRSVKQNGRLVTDNILTLDSLDVERLVNKSHFPYWSPGSSSNDLWNKKYLSHRIKLQSQNPYGDLNRKYEFCKDGKVIAQVKLSKSGTSHYPEDGKYPADIIRFFKDGLPTKIKNDFEVSGGFSALGAGDSHAEDSDGLVSYQYSAYISEKQQKDLGLKKARFFVISRYGNYENPRVLYTTFDINMNKLRQENLDLYCPGQNPNGEGLEDPAFNGAG